MKNNNNNKPADGAPLPAILAAEAEVKALRAKLAFVVTLSAQERAALRLPGEREFGALEKAVATAKEHAALLPAGFDSKEFEQQAQVVAAVHRCWFQLSRAALDLQDTLRSVSAEPLKAATQVRGYVKTAAVRAPELDAVSRRLRPRPHRASPRSEPESAPPAQPPGPPAQSAA